MNVTIEKQRGLSSGAVRDLLCAWGCSALHSESWCFSANLLHSKAVGAMICHPLTDSDTRALQRRYALTDSDLWVGSQIWLVDTIALNSCAADSGELWASVTFGLLDAAREVSFAHGSAVLLHEVTGSFVPPYLVHVDHKLLGFDRCKDNFRTNSYTWESHGQSILVQLSPTAESLRRLAHDDSVIRDANWRIDKGKRLAQAILTGKSRKLDVAHVESFDLPFKSLAGRHPEMSSLVEEVIRASFPKALENPEDGFMQLGADSLDLQDMTKQLSAKLNVALPLTTLIDYCSIASLKEHLVHSVRSPGETQGSAQPQRQLHEKAISKVFRGAFPKALENLDDGFMQLGADSLDLQDITKQLSEALDSELPLTTLIDYCSLRSLTNHLVDSCTANGTSSRISPADSESPGSPLRFRHLAKVSAIELPLYLQHGFVSIGVLSALDSIGILQELPTMDSVTPDSFHSSHGVCKSGYLLSCLNLMTALGLLTPHGDGRYRPSDRMSEASMPFASLATYLNNDFQSLPGWQSDPLLMMDSPDVVRCLKESSNFVAGLVEAFFAAPVIVYTSLLMRQSGMRDGVLTADALDLSEAALCAIDKAMVGLDLYEDTRSRTLNSRGSYLMASALTAGVPISYYPLYRELPMILRGDDGIFAGQNSEQRETHVDRVLNVIASGAQHHRFFEKMCDEIIRPIFNNDDHTAQPTAIVDMGCGDGELLRSLYSYITKKTKRGGSLTSHPLVMVGVDFSDESLEVTRANLLQHSVPHIAFFADIGQPERLLEDLNQQGFGADDVLHVRTFIDHDRPYAGPVGLTDTYDAYKDGIYVSPEGMQIAPAAMLQSLREHLGRWRGIMGRHGLVLLEAGQLPPHVAGQHFASCTSIAFDCCQSLSHQYPVPLHHFVVCAAHAGLFCSPRSLHLYPKSTRYTRVLLSHLKARAYYCRHARPSDLSACIKLEAQSWEEAMRTSEDALKNRLANHPTCAFAMCDMNDEVIGVVYFQFISEIADLKRVTWTTKETLRRNSGPYLQLLDIFVDKTASSSYGGDIGLQLRDFVLCYARCHPDVKCICGVTRARNYLHRGEGRTYEEYVMDGNGVHDAGLALHTRGGAKLLEVVRGWRPEDGANEGCGVLMVYDLQI